MAPIKLLFAKSWVLFIVIVAASGIGGGAYAAWTASLHVEGTIQTGNVDVVWDMQSDREFVGILDPATGQVVNSPIPAGKDVADCFSDLQPDTTARTVKFEVSNAYPSYTCEITLGALVTGSVPVHISSIKREVLDAEGNQVLDNELNMDVELNRKIEVDQGVFRCDPNQPVGISTQLHRGDRFCAIISIHATMAAQQSHNYTGSLWIDLIQWNFAGAQDLRSRVAQQLAGDVFAFDLVSIDPASVAQLIALPPGETSRFPIPVVGPNVGEQLVMTPEINRIALRPNLPFVLLKSPDPQEPGSILTTELAAPDEMSFRMGGAECEQHSDDGTAPTLCGALNVISEKDMSVAGMVMDSKLGLSFIEPVDMVLGTPGENPGMHVVYNSENTANPFTDDEEPPDDTGQVASLGSDTIQAITAARKSAGLASSLDNVQASHKSFNSNIVLDGDRTFYAANPATVWQRMDAIWNNVDVIYTVIEPLSFDWSLDLNVKGMEVWVSGGPTTTDKVGLSNELSDPGYFLLNPVTDQEIHYFFAGYNVSGVYGRASGIGNSSSSSFGGGAGKNHAYGEARTSQTLKTKWVVMAHEVGHLIGGRHGDGQTSGCAGGFLFFLCGPSIMPAGSAGAPDVRKPYFSNANDTNIIGTLNAVIP